MTLATWANTSRSFVGPVYQISIRPIACQPSLKILPITVSLNIFLSKKWECNKLLYLAFSYPRLPTLISLLVLIFLIADWLLCFFIS